MTTAERIEQCAMSRERYEETQTLPDRVDGTERGKAWVREFIDATEQRYAAEYPDKIDEYREDLQMRITDCMYLFAKYALNELVDLDTGFNSEVVLYAEASNGENVLWFNILHGNAARYLNYMFRKLYRSSGGAKQWRVTKRIARKRKRKSSRWALLKIQIAVDGGLWGWLAANTRLFWAIAMAVGNIHVWRFNRRAKKNEREMAK